MFFQKSCQALLLCLNDCPILCHTSVRYCCCVYYACICMLSPCTWTDANRPQAHKATGHRPQVTQPEGGEI